jgi:hypothetical protein
VSICRPEHEDFPDLGIVCCYGVAIYGPHACTCWEAVYSANQTPPTIGMPSTRRLMCEDCAYRPGSPEKRDDPMYRGDATELEMAAETGRFFCHQGLRRVEKWVHPSGTEHVAPPGGYDPPVVDSVPYRADGTPEELCAGWDARRRALAAEDGAVHVP